ncbi:hypothetical protein B0H12DRAFT_1074906 [Mycena haematopus]|nr:hypothetical protein B0H12DRAFT_1074906 [Mycena haematopus]
MRAVFLGKLFTDLPQLRSQMAELSNTEFLKAIIYPRSTIALVAKFAYEVLELFYEVPVFRLTSSTAARIYVDRELGWKDLEGPGDEGVNSVYVWILPGTRRS